MKEPFYITRSGLLRRQHDTVRFDHDQGHVYLPIEQMDALYIFEPMDLNTALLDFFSKHKIPVHFFGYQGKYIGSFTPRDAQLSGFLLVKQALAVEDLSVRIPLAKEIMRGAQANILKNVRRLRRENKLELLDPLVENLVQDMKNTEKSTSIPQLMGYEGNVRKKYYQIMDQIMVVKNKQFVMDGRVYHPPNNKMNSLISFVNSLVYTTTINQIYRTSLNPTLSFLHQPGERRYSLALDISEVFKPVVADKVIFRLIGLGMLNDSCFDEAMGLCYLNKKGRDLVVSEYNQRLKTTIHHRELDQKSSYERLIRLECYKLVRHILGEKIYSSFKMWW
ncbi:CRISP-associated protein Cas1 [Thermoactinomyces sp. DSM 45891]|uniref:type I-B CRISPR-associated endonuclease Cas1b n=1 Tax=Thermoactinomyces sp. DSM 45891 TaxID=1761907 RepID=UPI00091F84B3|nr:type I-B CRISPR-associated endonuclease Cas1b [Thermoactinomyces sp. DSM 45891]SFX78633.1 CRISP-associated protein Cas1 [Thermoactinomyces sp. DSM 45891]